MNILFLTMSRIFDLEQHGIYQDLLWEFVRNKHNVHIVTHSEWRYDEEQRVKNN